MSSSDFFNETHVGKCLALENENSPSKYEPWSKGGRRTLSHEIQGGEKSADWENVGRLCFFLTMSTFKKHLGAILRAGAAAQSFQPLALPCQPLTRAFYGQDCKEH